jgi:hypothetical protein
MLLAIAFLTQLHYAIISLVFPLIFRITLSIMLLKV